MKILDRLIDKFYNRIRYKIMEDFNQQNSEVFNVINIIRDITKFENGILYTYLPAHIETIMKDYENNKIEFKNIKLENIDLLQKIDFLQDKLGSK